MYIPYKLRTEGVDVDLLSSNKNEIITIFNPISGLTDSPLRISSDLWCVKSTTFQGSINALGNLIVRDVFPRSKNADLGKPSLSFSKLFVNEISIGDCDYENSWEGYTRKVAWFTRGSLKWNLKASKIINPDHKSNDALLLGSGNVGHRPQIIDLT